MFGPSVVGIALWKAGQGQAIQCSCEANKKQALFL